MKRLCLILTLLTIASKLYFSLQYSFVGATNNRALFRLLTRIRLQHCPFSCSYTYLLRSIFHILLFFSWLFFKRFRPLIFLIFLLPYPFTAKDEFDLTEKTVKINPELLNEI